MQTSFLMNWADDSLDPSQYGYTHNTSESGFVEVAQTSQNVLTTGAILGLVDSLSGPEAVEGGFRPNAFEPSNTEATSMLDQIHASSFIGTAQPSRSGSDSSARDWKSLMNWSPSLAPSIVAIAERSSDRLSLPQDTVPSSATDVLPFVTGDQIERGSYGTVFRVRIAKDKPVTCAGFDPCSGLLPLLLLKAQLEQDLYSDPRSNYYSCGYELAKLFDIVHSEWLKLELDNVVCWISDRVSKEIRGRQVRRSVESLGSPLEDSRELSKHRRRSSNKSETADGFKMLETTRTLTESHNGVLSVTLGTLLNQEVSANAVDVLKLSFMPKECRRATGLHVTLFNVMREIRGPRISPRLRTFNVVPDDSEIVKSVRYNDIHRLQTLLDKGEASPTDVDSRGFSLLSVSVSLGKQ